MKTKLLELWIHLRSSFWFVPALMILATALLAGFLVQVDAGLGAKLADEYPRIFGASPDGARSLLSAIAGSMISIAGVTFSITIVALSLASVQYSSRILRNFMRDRANQSVLGVFLSIFVYCLIVLRAVHGGDQPFVPSLSVAVGIVLGIVGIAFLIFFIHHVATSIQASTIISTVGADTVSVIDALYPEEHAGEAEDDAESERCLRENSWTNVLSPRTGFVQTVDTNGLAEWAEQNQTMVHTFRGIGEFVIADKPLLAVAGRVQPSSDAVKALTGCFNVASFRTIEQDAGFGIRQLVDISLKALSPGVNDTTTAVTCVNYLGAILARLGMRKIPAAITRRREKVRLIARAQTYEFLAGEALQQIRENTRGNVAVLLALLEAIESALHPGLSQSRRHLLKNHLDRCWRVAEENVKDEGDRAVIQDRFQKVTKMLSAR